MNFRALPRVVSAVAMGCYVLIVYGAVATISAVLGVGGPSRLGPLVATTVTALSYARVHQMVASVLATRFGRRRMSPEDAAVHLFMSSGAEVSPREILVAVAELIGRATGAAAVGVRPAVASWPAAEWAAENSDSPLEAVHQHVIPIVFEDELIGEICIRSRSGEGPTPKEREMIGGLADQVALLIRNTTLADEIQAQIEEINLRASEIRAARRRTVEAQDAERRTLERNIHDGVQQYLVAMAVRLSLARRSSDEQKARDALAGAARLATEALDRLEELTSGVSSVVLLEQGLGPALRRAADASPVPVEVTDAGVGRLPQDAEVAIYFSCLEALQNAVKHSGASEITIVLAVEGDELRFTVSDNGRGFDTQTVTRGVGLRNLSDRLVGLGGSLEISSRVGAGTSVRGTVPVQARAVL